MNCQKEFLPQSQQDQLHSFLNTAEFRLFVDCLKAELAAAQTNLVDVAIWSDESLRAKEQTKLLICRAQKYTLALEAIQDCSKSEYKFINVNLNP